MQNGDDTTIDFPVQKASIVPMDFSDGVDATALYDIYIVKHINDLVSKYKPKLARTLQMAVFALAKLDSPESRGARVAIALGLGWKPPVNQRKRFSMTLEQRAKVAGIIEASKLSTSDPRKMMKLSEEFWKETAAELGFIPHTQREVPGEDYHSFTAEVPAEPAKV